MFTDRHLLRAGVAEIWVDKAERSPVEGRLTVFLGLVGRSIVSFKGLITATAALALVAAPTVAAAAPQAAVSVAPASESVEGDSALRGCGGFIVAIIAAAAIIAGIIIIANEDDEPNSP